MSDPTNINEDKTRSHSLSPNVFIENFKLIVNDALENTIYGNVNTGKDQTAIKFAEVGSLYILEHSLK